jgi:hypothetical protein
MTDLTRKQVTILKAMDQLGGKATRPELIEVTGQPRGYAKAMGAPTVGNIAPDSLEGRGLVRRRDLSIPLEYEITAAGRKAIGV